MKTFIDGETHPRTRTTWRPCWRRRVTCPSFSGSRRKCPRWTPIKSAKQTMKRQRWPLKINVSFFPSFTSFLGLFPFRLASPPTFNSVTFTLRNCLKRIMNDFVSTSVCQTVSFHSASTVILATSAVFLPSRYRLDRAGCLSVGRWLVVRHIHACTDCPPVCSRSQTWTLAWIWSFE